MTPPSRTISAARRMSRSCGLSGCSSKYWLKRIPRRGTRCGAGPVSYAPARAALAYPVRTSIDGNVDRTRTADRVLRQLENRRHLRRDRGAYGRDAVAAGLGLVAQARDSEDAPRECGAGVDLRCRHADPA